MDIPENCEIDALVPEYTPQGDATHVYLRDGRDFLVPVTLRTMLKYLAYRSCRDMTRLRAWAAEHTHHQLNNPLPVDEELVLCPFKARKPRIHGDPTMGCVNAAAEVTLAPSREAILLTSGGHELLSLWSRATTQRHLDRAALISRDLQGVLDEKILRRLRKLYQIRV